MVKFGDCPCTEDEEDWEHTETEEYPDTVIAHYECNTCGETDKIRSVIY